MQVLFPPSYACCLPSRSCVGGLAMWLAIALYYVVGNALYQVVGQYVARRECKCFSSLFVWPGPLPLMKSKYRKSRHIHCNIFHIFATFFIFLKHFPYFCNEYWRNSESFGENLLTLFFLAKNIFRFVSIMIIFPEQ